MQGFGMINNKHNLLLSQKHNSLLPQKHNSLLPQKKAQVSDTIQWIAAFVVIFFIIAVFLFISKGLSNDKKIENFRTVSSNSLIASKLLTSFLEKDSGEGIKIYDALYTYGSNGKADINWDSLEKNIIDYGALLMTNNFPEKKYNYAWMIFADKPNIFSTFFNSIDAMFASFGSSPGFPNLYIRHDFRECGKENYIRALIKLDKSRGLIICARRTDE